MKFLPENDPDLYHFPDGSLWLDDDDRPRLAQEVRKERHDAVWGEIEARWKADGDRYAPLLAKWQEQNPESIRDAICEYERGKAK